MNKKCNQKQQHRRPFNSMQLLKHEASSLMPFHPACFGLTLDAKARLSLLHRHEGILDLKELPRPAEGRQRKAVRGVSHGARSACFDAGFNREQRKCKEPPVILLLASSSLRGRCPAMDHVVGYLYRTRPLLIHRENSERVLGSGDKYGYPRLFYMACPAARRSCRAGVRVLSLTHIGCACG